MLGLLPGANDLALVRFLVIKEKASAYAGHYYIVCQIFWGVQILKQPCNNQKHIPPLLKSLDFFSWSYIL
jgi:hypothetical protein